MKTEIFSTPVVLHFLALSIWFMLITAAGVNYKQVGEPNLVSLILGTLSFLFVSLAGIPIVITKKSFGLLPLKGILAVIYGYIFIVFGLVATLIFLFFGLNKLYFV